MPPRRSQGFVEDVGADAQLRARWEIERDVVCYAVVLLALTDREWRAVVLFDCSHDDRNDRHDYTHDGIKGPATTFHHGVPGEALRAALALIRADHRRMIERWQP